MQQRKQGFSLLSSYETGLLGYRVPELQQPPRFRSHLPQCTWNVGIGIAKSVFTLDFRYYDTDMNKGDCNAFTSDQTARFTNSVTSINPGGFGSNWCGASFVVAGKFDLTAMSNLK